MTRKLPLRSDIAWATSDRIVVRGLDLPTEIIGQLNLGYRTEDRRGGKQ